MGNAAEGPAYGHKGLALRIQKFYAQGRRRTAAAIVGSAAAQAQNDTLRAAPESMGYELAYAVGGGVGHPAILPHQGQARGGGHLDDGGFPIREKPVVGRKGAAIGVPAGHGYFFAAQSPKEGIHRTLAAVSHREGTHPGLRVPAAYFPGNNVTDLPRGQAALEGVGDDHIFAHNTPSRKKFQCPIRSRWRLCRNIPMPAPQIST